MRDLANLPGFSIPKAVANRTVSVCNKSDLVCDFNVWTLHHYTAAAKVHTTSYVGRSPLRVTAARAAAISVRSFPTVACATANAYIRSVCVAAAAGSPTALTRLMYPDYLTDRAYVARMNQLWATPEAQLQMVRALHAPFAGADSESWPFFAQFYPGGVVQADSADLIAAAAWLGFSVPTSYPDHWIPPYRGLVVSVIDNWDNTMYLGGVFHYGTRDASGQLCSWPGLPRCV